MRFKKFVIPALSTLLIFIGTMCYFGAIWVKQEFGNVGVPEIVYTMTQPLKGTDINQILNFLKGPFAKACITTIIILFVILFLVNVLMRYTKKKNKISNRAI